MYLVDFAGRGCKYVRKYIRLGSSSIVVPNGKWPLRSAAFYGLPRLKSVAVTYTEATKHI